MQKIDFTQYETKDAFLKAFPIKGGSLNLGNKCITDRDLTYILKLLGTDPNLKGLSLYNNQLTTISDKAFSGLTNLEELSLYNNQLTTLPNSLKKALPNCTIHTDANVRWVDNVVKQETVDCGNCIDEIKNKISNIDLQISKLQEDKEVLKKALQIMINN